MYMNHSTTIFANFDDGWTRSVTLTPFYHVSRERLVSQISDNHIALFLPIIVYWLFSIFFHCLDVSGWEWLQKYKLHDSDEAKSRNSVSISHVVLVVLSQQVFQTLVGLWWMTEERRVVDHADQMRDIAIALQPVERFVQWNPEIFYRLVYLTYWWIIPGVEFLSAMLIFDTWQYFLHRVMHTNKFLYRHVHSWHHRLYVPYAFGALYNHPIEGCLVDTLGLAIMDLLTRMTTRQLIVFFVLFTLKNVDHHCGYRMPLDPLQMFTKNDAEFHDTHHQTFGMKHNFSQSFFLHWDVILGTYLIRNSIKRGHHRKQAY